MTYRARYEALVARYDSAKAELNTISRDRLETAGRREKLTRFLAIMHDMKHAPAEFDETLWRETAETMTVYSLDDMMIRFHGGIEIHI